MKQIYLTLIFILGVLSLIAQERWGVYYGSIAGSHFAQIETCGDSVSLGGNSPKYERIYVTQFDFTNSDLGRRTVGDSVFLKNLLDNSLETLLYDYSVVEGDTVIGDWGAYVVTAVETVFVLDKERKQITMEGTFDGHVDIWIQGIGSVVSGYITPGMPKYIPDSGASFTCYYDPVTSQFYVAPDAMDCELRFLESACPASNIADQNLSAHQNFKIFPNPSAGVVKVKLANKGSSTFQIYAFDGKLILSGLLEQSETNLDLSFLDKGMYVFKLNQENEVSMQKLIVN